MPTIVGVSLNEMFPSVVKKITRMLPLIGVVLTTLLCASPVGQVSGVLKCVVDPCVCTSRAVYIARSQAPCCRLPQPRTDCCG